MDFCLNADVRCFVSMSPSRSLSPCLHAHTYTYVCVCAYIYMYMYIRFAYMQLYDTGECFMSYVCIFDSWTCMQEGSIRSCKQVYFSFCSPGMLLLHLDSVSTGWGECRSPLVAMLAGSFGETVFSIHAKGVSCSVAHLRASGERE